MERVRATLGDGRVRAALGDEIVAVFAEKDEEPELIARYGLSIFPTFVWTDARGEAQVVTPQPADADEVLADLRVMRGLLAPVDAK